MSKVFKLSDEFIGQLAKLVSLSMLTGTENVVDHMRQLRLQLSEEKESELVLTKEYKEYYENVLNKLLSKVEELSKDMKNNIITSTDN